MSIEFIFGKPCTEAFPSLASAKRGLTMRKQLSQMNLIYIASLIHPSPPLPPDSMT